MSLFRKSITETFLRPFTDNIGFSLRSIRDNLSRCSTTIDTIKEKLGGNFSNLPELFSPITRNLDVLHEDIVSLDSSCKQRNEYLILSLKTVIAENLTKKLNYEIKDKGKGKLSLEPSKSKTDSEDKGLKDVIHLLEELSYKNNKKDVENLGFIIHDQNEYFNKTLDKMCEYIFLLNEKLGKENKCNCVAKINDKFTGI